MKKYTVQLLFLFVFSGAMNLKAQYYERAVLGRFGTEIMLGFKQFFLYHPNPQLSWEVLTGVQLDERTLALRPGVTPTNGYVLQGMCYYHLDIGFDTGFQFYTGLGPFLGIYTPQGKTTVFGAGVAAAVGFSYTFTHIPLDISLDWMPILGSPRMSVAKGGITFKYILPTGFR